MIARHVQSYHSQLESFLLEQADTAARETGFVRRKSPLSGSLFVQTLIWSVWQEKLRSLAAYLDTLETLDPRVQISVQSLHERFTARAVALLRTLFAKALALKTPLPEPTRELLTGFSAFYIADSTAVPLPKSLAQRYAGWGGAASTAAAKVLVVMEWFSGTLSQIHLHSGRTPDQGLGPSLLAASKAGVLWLFDLGFWSCAFLAQVAGIGSFFVCRLQTKVTVREVVEGTDQDVDVDAWLRGEVGADACERAIVLGHKATRLEARLIGQAVPEAVANARRRKLREKARNQGRTLCKSTLFRQGYTLMVTNVSAEQLPATALWEVYRVRWQVELLFKLAKSDAGLTTYTSENAERVECELYAVLMALLWVGQWRELISGQVEEISLVKLWRRLGPRVLTWGAALRQGRGLSRFLFLLQALARHARVSKRKKYPSPCQRLEALNLPSPRHPGPSASSQLPMGGLLP